MNYTDLVQGAYLLLGRPGQPDLPFQDVLTHAGDVVRGRFLDLRLARNSHETQRTGWVTPSARSVASSAFSITGNYLPTKVEWRFTDADTSIPPFRAEIVAPESMDERYYLSRKIQETYVAFENQGTTILFSESTNVLAKRQYRIWYEDLNAITTPAIGGTVDILEPFLTLLKYELALRLIDQVRTGTSEWAEERERLRQSLKAVLAMEEARWEKWRTSYFGDRKVKKLGYRPRMRYGR